MKTAPMKHVAALRLFPVLLACLLAMLPAAAQERITAYDSEIDIRADGSLDVTENITVYGQGTEIRRGIYRDFPTRYKDRYGNRVVVEFQMLDVQRNGSKEPWFIEKIGNGVRVNTGDDDMLPLPGLFKYTLRYRTTRQLGFFADHDELYWNAIGTGWVFPIERGSVIARLPVPVAPDVKLHVEGYTGAQGEQEQNYTADVSAPGTARWQLTQPLGPQQGFTVVMTFPKGIVTPPIRSQRILWFFKDNRGVWVALFGLFALLAYCVRRWRAVGRDPQGGPIIARYGPPKGHSPGDLRYIRRMGYDMRCFSADLLELAVGGSVRIHRDKGMLKDKWRLEYTGSPPAFATAAQTQMVGHLFSGGSMLELVTANATRLQGAHVAHKKAMDELFQPAMFQRHGKSIGIAVAIAIVSIVLAFIAGGGAGVLAILAVAVLMVVAICVFGALVKAPTREGRKMLDEIEGLRRYLGVAERDELASMTGPYGEPELDADRYERLLPYAVALDVEDAWTKKFTLAVGAAAAAQATSAIAWYQGGNVGNLGSLVNAVGSGLSSQIASSSTPPGSSSGSGGGGSSGGGGGGGGGGGR